MYSRSLLSEAKASFHGIEAGLTSFHSPCFIVVVFVVRIVRQGGDRPALGGVDEDGAAVVRGQ